MFLSGTSPNLSYINNPHRAYHTPPASAQKPTPDQDGVRATTPYEGWGFRGGGSRKTKGTGTSVDEPGISGISSFKFMNSRFENIPSNA
jgi:hypothetical protein